MGDEFLIVSRNTCLEMHACDVCEATSNPYMPDERPKLCVSFEADCHGDAAHICLDCLRQAEKMYAEGKRGPDPFWWHRRTWSVKTLRKWIADYKQEKSIPMKVLRAQLEQAKKYLEEAERAGVAPDH